MYQGVCKVKQTRIINPGNAEDNKYAILDIKDTLNKSKLIPKSI